jgi:O-antigen/teichoic acid export membrane protein
MAVFTRLFAPAEYGQYALVYASAAAAIGIVTWATHSSTIRYRASSRSEGWSVQFETVFFGLLLVLPLSCLLAGAALWPIVKSVAGGYQRYYWVAVGIVCGGVGFYHLGALYRADFRPRDLGVSVALVHVLRLFLGVVFVLLIHRDVVWLLVAAAIAYFLILTGMLAKSRVRVSLLVQHLGDYQYLLPRLRAYLGFGIPMLVWAVGSQVLFLSDRYVIEVLRGSEDVGLYASNAALGVAAAGLVVGPFSQALHPLFMSAASDPRQREGLPVLYRAWTRAMLLVALPFVAASGVFSADLASVAFGEAFRVAHPVIPLMVGSAFMWELGALGQKAIELDGTTGKLARAVVMCTAVNVGANVLVIPRYGVVGAAFVSLMSSALYPILVRSYGAQSIRWELPVWSVLRGVVAAAVVTALFVVLRRLLLPLVPALGLILVGGLLPPIYVAALLVLGEVSLPELRAAVRSAVRSA